MDTGALQASYTHQTDRTNLEAAVGSDEPHSVYLELGTVHMAPRPHMIPTLLNEADNIAREIARP
jgi:hypothetical protein